MARTNFFEERLDQSEVKARIVQKYFQAWARVIMPHAQKRGGKIGYVDLYAGPGRYKDGSASTPLLVLEKAIGDPQMSQMLVAMFNDADPNHTATLEAEIKRLSGIEKLKHQPQITTGEVDDDAAHFFAQQRMMPSFTFFDPFGYKGLSLKIVNGVIKDWGCDCIFFFNYTRINPGISNPAFDEHIDSLFGKPRADGLREKLDGKRPHQREAMILEELAGALRGMGGKFVLPFRFKKEKRTSHFLVFVSKNVLGYKIMKGIMATESSTEDQGVPSFCYSPADESTPLLFSLARPLEALEDDLLNRFRGRRLTMQDVFEQHHVDTPYIEKNYKAALARLESAGKITCDPAASHRKKGTFADRVVVDFPR